MRVLVHVRETCVPVSVGEGTQLVRWLANVGIARHDEGRALGLPMGVKAEDGSLLSMDASLVEAGIKDLTHVWVVLRGASRPAAPLLLLRQPPSPTPAAAPALSQPRAGHLDETTEKP